MVENGRGDWGRFQRAVLVSPDPRLREPVDVALGLQMELVHLSYAELPAILASGSELCLVDVSTERARAIEIVRQASEAGLAVIALHRSNEPNLILEALRAGAGEFLFDPINPQDLLHAVARLARRPTLAPRQQRGKIWMVLPAKTVTLSSLVSCHLAERLARRPGLRVLLADMDPVQGSIGFLLKLKAQFSVADALANPSHLETDLWKKLTTRYAGLDVLLAPEQPQLDTFDPAGVAPVFQFLRRAYEVTVVDSPGPVSPWQLQMARRCDELIVVTSNDLAAVQVTQRTLRLLEAEGVVPARIRLLLHAARQGTGLSRESIEAALHQEVFHTLPPEAEEARAAALQGKPATAAPRLAKSLDELCHYLLGMAPPEARKSWGTAWPKFLIKKPSTP